MTMRLTGHNLRTGEVTQAVPPAAIANFDQITAALTERLADAEPTQTADALLQLATMLLHPDPRALLLTMTGNNQLHPICEAALIAALKAQGALNQ